MLVFDAPKPSDPNKVPFKQFCDMGDYWKIIVEGKQESDDNLGLCAKDFNEMTTLMANHWGFLLYNVTNKHADDEKNIPPKPKIMPFLGKVNLRYNIAYCVNYPSS